MPILLKDVLPINNLADYKVHFAKWNQENQPLDVFVKTGRNGRAGRNIGPPVMTLIGP